MTNSPSPYALLCACKPKPIPSFSTEYDLYSASQHTESKTNDVPVSISKPMSAESGIPHTRSENSACSNASIRKTHYISDIHSRHHQAIRRSTLMNHPIS